MVFSEHLKLTKGKCNAQLQMFSFTISGWPYRQVIPSLPQQIVKFDLELSSFYMSQNVKPWTQVKTAETLQQTTMAS